MRKKRQHKNKQAEPSASHRPASRRVGAATSAIVAFAMLFSGVPKLHLLPSASAAKASKHKKRHRSGGLHGTASWYGRELQGRRTASGERFNMHAMTAAHRSLPLKSRVRVRNLRTGRVVLVRITDRGPYARGRIIDLSYAAAQAIGMKGTDPVALEVVAKAQVAKKYRASGRRHRNA